MTQLRLKSFYALGCGAIALALCSCEQMNVPRVMKPGSFTTVVIDAGHGGKDPGERPRGGQPEKDFALDTARRLQPLLREAGFKTVMTRSEDVFVELDDRVAIADRNGPAAILVSIHYNASPNSGPRGIETYFWRADSYGMATRVQRNILSETGMPNHGVIRRALRLTHAPTVPCILCECGYLTNHTDYAQVLTPAYRQKLAEGIADGIVEQHDKGDESVGTLPPVQATTVIHHSYRHHHIKTATHHSSSKGSNSSKARSSTAKKKKTSSSSNSSAQ